MIAPQLFKAGVREGLNAIEKENPTFEEFNRRTKVISHFNGMIVCICFLSMLVKFIITRI